MLGAMHWHDRDHAFQRHFSWGSFGWLSSPDDASAVFNAGNDWCIFDGWIANSDEVLRALVPRDAAVPTAVRDAEIVWLARQRWGREWVNHVDGQYVAVTISGETGKLECTKDLWGARGCAFATFNSGIAVASLPCALLAHEEVSGALNISWCAGYLADRPPEATDSPYEAIRNLQGGHLLSFDPADHAVRSRACATIPTSRSRESDPSIAIAEVRTEICSLVNAALPQNGVAALQLSGGIDSSTLCSAADVLISNGHVSRDRLLATSLRFPQMACDEQPYIAAVTSRLSFGAMQTPWQRPALSSLVQMCRALRVPPPPLNYLFFLDQSRDLRRQGIRVQLTGRGGDELFLLTSGELRRQLLNVRAAGLWPRYARDLFHIARRSPGTWAWLHTLMSDFLAGTTLHSLLKACRPREPNLSSACSGNWNAFPPEEASHLAAETVAIAISQSRRLALSHGWTDAISRYTGIESRDPLLTRRATRLGLRVPLTACDPFASLRRTPLRGAFAAELPTTVANRTTKASFDAPWSDSAKPLVDEFDELFPDAGKVPSLAGAGAKSGFDVSRAMKDAPNGVAGELAFMFSVFLKATSRE